MCHSLNRGRSVRRWTFFSQITLVIRLLVSFLPVRFVFFFFSFLFSFVAWLSPLAFVIAIVNAMNLITTIQLVNKCVSVYASVFMCFPVRWQFKKSTFGKDLSKWYKNALSNAHLSLRNITLSFAVVFATFAQYVYCIFLHLCIILI